MLDTQLTGLEKLVASGFIQGMKPLEVAGRLGLSVWTVRNLVVRLRLRFRANSFGELVALLTREEELRIEVLKVPIARSRQQPPEVLLLLPRPPAKSDA